MSLSEKMLALYKDAQKEDERAVALEKLVMATIAAKSEEPGDDGFFRVSQAYYICPRASVYWALLPHPENAKICFAPGLRLRMDVGTLLHAYMQNEVLGPAGVLVGYWRRLYKVGGRVKEFLHDGFFPKTEDRDWLTPWQYQEMKLENADTGYRGHPDGIVCVSRLMNPNVTIPAGITTAALIRGETFGLDWAHFEFKTTDDSKLRDIKANDWRQGEIAYRMQASLYQKLLGCKSSLVLYMDRKYFGLHAFWYEGEVQLVADAEKKVADIRSGITTGKVPERCPECLSAMSTRAKTCPYAPACFAPDPNLIIELAKG